MYTALALLIAGILTGRFLRNFIAGQLLNKPVFAIVLMLLFLLGGQIGANDSLLASLGSIGYQAFALMLAAVAGSICMIRLMLRVLARLRISLIAKKRDA